MSLFSITGQASGGYTAAKKGALIAVALGAGIIVGMMLANVACRSSLVQTHDSVSVRIDSIPFYYSVPFYDHIVLKDVAPSHIDSTSATLDTLIVRKKDTTQAKITFDWKELAYKNIELTMFGVKSDTTIFIRNDTTHTIYTPIFNKPVIADPVVFGLGAGAVVTFIILLKLLFPHL